MSDYDDDERSTDGSDSEGSLVDFIAKSDDDSGEESEVEEEETTHTDEAKALVDEFPFDRSLLEERATAGPRRSTRQRKQAARYVDPNYARMMYDDVDPNALESSEEEIAEEEEEDFVVDDDMDDSTDEEDEEEEEKPATTQPRKRRKISTLPLKEDEKVRVSVTK